MMRATLITSLVVQSTCLLAAERVAGAVAPAKQYDVIVYGGASAEVTAAVQAARMGKSVIIVCPAS